MADEKKRPEGEEVAETPEEQAGDDEQFAEDEVASEGEGYEEGEEEGYDDGEEVGEEEGFEEGEGEEGFDDEFPDAQDPSLDPLAEGLPEEPLGASIIRRVHEDHSILMRDYDEMVGLLEQPKVKQWVVKKLMDCEQTLDQCERLFAGLYPDLPPLSEDSDGDAADADGFEEQPGLAEGDPAEGDYVEEEPTGERVAPERVDSESDAGDDVDGVGGEGEGETGPASKGPEDSPEDAVEGMKRGRKSLTDVITKAYDGNASHHEDEVSDHAPHSLPLRDHELESAKKAHSFLESKGSEEGIREFGKKDQMLAFHHGETLHEISGKSGGKCCHCGKGLKDSKCVECSTKGLKDSETHPHRIECGKAGDWLHEMAGKKAPGLKDCEKCMECAKSLSSVFDSQKDDEDENKAMDSDDATEPGDIGEKDMDGDDEGVEEKGIKRKKGRPKKGEEEDTAYEGKKPTEAYRAQDRANKPRERGMPEGVRKRADMLIAASKVPALDRNKQQNEVAKHAIRTIPPKGKGGDDLDAQTKSLIEENVRQQKGLSDLNSTLERLLLIV